jgi:hypothetical protein
MADENPFEKELRASQRKQAVAVGGLMIFAGVATAVGKWWATKNKQRNIEEASTKLSECNESIDAASPYFTDLVSADYLVLDSNVWMAPEADALLRLLKDFATKRGGRVCILTSQTKEIDNLKNPPKGSGVKHNEGPHGRARHAIKRMDEFRNAGLLRLVDDTAIAAGRTHADDVFIDYFLSGAPPSATIRFVTDDGGLRLKLMKVEEAKPGLYQTIDRSALFERAGNLDYLCRKRLVLEHELKRLRGG